MTDRQQDESQEEQRAAESTPAADDRKAERSDAWQRRVIGLSALAAVLSAVLAVTANLSEIAGWFAPDETRELVEETRGVIVGTDEKVEELVAMLRVQAVASGLDLSIESEATIKSAVKAIVESGNAQKRTALAHLADGDVEAAAGRMASVAASQATAVSTTREAAATSWREAAALQRTFDLAAAVGSYEQANSLQPNHPETLERLGHTLVRAGKSDDGESRFRQLLALNPPPSYLSSAYLGLGGIAKVRGQYEQAEIAFRDSLAIAERNRLPAERLYALHALGQLSIARGNLDDARNSLDAAMTIAEELGDDPLTASVLNARAILAARLGRYDEAETLLQQAVDIHAARNDRAGRAQTLANLGALALSRGDLQSAEPILLETVTLGEQLGWPSSVAYDLVNLAAISAASQRYSEADERLARAQSIAESVGLAELAPVIVFNRGEIARDAGDIAMACGHWLQALHMMVAMGSAHVDTARAEIERERCEE